ncbi:ATP-dependent Clp protease adapter protein CLPS2, chloroplastic-like [Magnolia sinica]|uniref:ATP-dependent Clp protease adapter protein CLPS2, chloroplastic-like n=1 Tax=Magnolia sinica TaxID=86752 RepID=UPI0026596267|nr:ATP-dependent Clp protease adapter protein CLPS2, chloroplastic-like [Magnolia sinica]
MEMAIRNSAATFSSVKLSTPLPHFSGRARFLALKRTQEKEVVAPLFAIARFGSSGGGAGLLERPTFDQSQFDRMIQAEEGGDIGRVTDEKGTRGGDSYKVLLIDDARHTEKLVEKVLPQVVPSVTLDEARSLFHESRKNGVAVVIVALKEHAEFYAQMMIRKGLQSAIEPDSNTA